MYTVVDTFTRTFISMWGSLEAALAEVESYGEGPEGRYQVEYIGQSGEDVEW